ncbi:hypothetical protein [Yinghuangia soli]|uniref:Uncharacterized protein n=1 Tax=Yinghuangia soli TaxID=2908204 RepID=A0AA41PW69_9ACTN|nr:hypothetical protein [Yinghuangia soli]MCF2526863.1 hypothetical protein [Yinghuangia soli]
MSGTPRGPQGQPGQPGQGPQGDPAYGQWQPYAEDYAGVPAEGYAPAGYDAYPQQGVPQQGVPQPYAPYDQAPQYTPQHPQDYDGQYAVPGQYAADAYAPPAPADQLQPSAYGYAAPDQYAPPAPAAVPGEFGGYGDAAEYGYPPAPGSFGQEQGLGTYPEAQAYGTGTAVETEPGYVPDQGRFGDEYADYDEHDEYAATDYADGYRDEYGDGPGNTDGTDYAERFDPRDYDGAEPEPAAEAASAAAVASEREPLSRRVPIWHPPGLVPALLTAGLAAVLAATALAGSMAAVVGVAFLQVVTAAGWFRLHGMWPARQGIAVAILAGFAADAAVLLAGDDALAILPGILAGALGIVLLQQLARRDGRPELMPALTVTGSAALLTVLDVLFVIAARVEGPGVRDGALVVVGAAAVAAAVLPTALPLPAVAGHGLGLALAAGVGLVGASAFDLGSASVLLGLGAGLMGQLGRRAAGYDHPSRFVHMSAGVALPLVLAAPAVYLLGRVAMG